MLCFILIKYGRPLLGPRQCKFSVTCTDYALHQLKTRHFISACGYIIYRLLRCNPWYTPIC